MQKFHLAGRAWIALLLGLSIIGGGAPLAAQAAPAGQDKPVVRMGSANFTEQLILGELYGQVLEADGYRVERRLNLGSREIVFPALESGEINIYPEYLATLLGYATRGAEFGSSDPAVTQMALQSVLEPRGIAVLDYAPAVDVNALVVTRATADRYGISKTSDLAPIGDQLTLGAPPECPDRPFCMIGFRDVYGINFRSFVPLAPGAITVAALEAGQIDVALMFSTDAVIPARGLVMLEDDKHLQLADNVAPIVRRDLLNSAPAEFAALLNGVSTLLTTEELTLLNKQVDIDRMDPRDVARDWLRAKGLIA